MNSTFAHRNIIAFGIPVLIIAGLILLSWSPQFQYYPGALAIGITFDLVITVPLIFIVLIKKSRIPKITVSLFFISGLVVASMVVPVPHQSFLNGLKIWLLPALEAGVLIFLIVKVREVYKGYQLQKQSTFDFYSALKTVTNEVLPARINTIFAFEIAAFYYGFAHWKKVPLKKNEFSYHRESSAGIILTMIIFLVLAETFVLHLLVQRLNETVALILTAISLYSGLQIFGSVRSLSKRPVVLENQYLKLHFGIMADTTIQFDKIDAVELLSKGVNTDEQTTMLSPLGSLDANQNILIQLKSDNVLYGLYGKKRMYRNIVFHLDDKDRFMKQINVLLKEKS